VTMGEACRGPKTELAGIFPGSWIDANFYIWIGHRDDQRGWSQLAEARSTLDNPGVTDPVVVARARQEVLIAEGSDWFWWYGDDQSSEHDLEFDDLFRRHLRNVYRLLQKPVPDELFISNISAGAPPPAETAPAGLLAPTLDGEESSYFEWLGAGRLEVRDIAGAMHQTDRSAAVITLVWFGFDRSRFYVRVDGTRRIVDLLAEGSEFWLTFLKPEGLRFAVQAREGKVTGAYWERRTATPQWVERGAGGAAVAAGTVLEIALPLDDLHLPAAHASVAFFVAVYDMRRGELERHPAHRPIEAEVPDAGFEARNWTV
jgi:hypothetical protein